MIALVCLGLMLWWVVWLDERRRKAARLRRISRQCLARLNGQDGYRGRVK